jgi:hypothetical protein
MLYLKIKSNLSFLLDLHQDMVSNEHRYVTKMALCAKKRSLWAIFWIVEYLRRPIYLEYRNALCFDVECILNIFLYI